MKLYVIIALSIIILVFSIRNILNKINIDKIIDEIANVSKRFLINNKFNYNWTFKNILSENIRERLQQKNLSKFVDEIIISEENNDLLISVTACNAKIEYKIDIIKLKVLYEFLDEYGIIMVNNTNGKIELN